MGPVRLRLLLAAALALAALSLAPAAGAATDAARCTTKTWTTGKLKEGTAVFTARWCAAGGKIVGTPTVTKRATRVGKNVTPQLLVARIGFVGKGAARRSAYRLSLVWYLATPVTNASEWEGFGPSGRWTVDLLADGRVKKL